MFSDRDVSFILIDGDCFGAFGLFLRVLGSGLFLFLHIFVCFGV